MEVLIGGLCLLVSLAIALLVMFLILRGIWRALFHSAAKPSSTARCQRCGVEMPGHTCTTCGWQAPALNAPAFAFDTLRAQLEKLQREGSLPADSFQRLLASVAAEETRLAQSAPATLPSTPLPATVTENSTAPGDDSLVVPQMIAEPTFAVAESIEPSVPTEASPPRHDASPTLPVTPTIPIYVAAEEIPGTPAAAAVSPQGPSPASASVVAVPPRQRGLADLLSAFMEEKNVRWGELVGGLLIVGGSVALVISFWSQIAARPLLKFGLFNGVSASLFALGFYTARKWKLPTTSRGVLAIATLLVPLNFLSIAAFTQGALASDPKVLVGEVLSLGLFSTLVFLAGRAIVTPAPIAMTAGVMGASISSLLVRRWIDPNAPDSMLYILAALPLLCHGGAVATLIARLRKNAELKEPAINALLRMLGVTAFAALPPCGLLLALSGNIPETMQRLAPLVTLAGAPTMAVGLLLWRRVQNIELSGLRTAGTALTVLGSLIMLGGVVLAWPEPGLLVTVAGLCFVVLTTVALAVELAPAHLLAGVAFALGYLLLVQVVRGVLPWREVTTQQTTEALLSASSGNALTVLALLYGAGAAVWYRLRRPFDARYYAIIAGAAAVLSLTLVTLFGFRVSGDPHHATLIYALYAVATLIAAMLPWPESMAGQERAVRLRRWTAYAGSALLALALVQGIVYRPADGHVLAAPWMTAATAHALLVCLLASLTLRRRPRNDAGNPEANGLVVHDALITTGFITSAFAALQVGLYLLTIPLTNDALRLIPLAAHVAVLALVWFLSALSRRSSVLFDLSQSALFGVAGLGALDFASRQAWYATSAEPLYDPRMLQLQGSVAACLCLAWLALRWFLCRREDNRFSPLRSLLQRPTVVSIDYLATGMLVLGLLGLTAYAALPGTLQELANEQTVRAIAAQAPQSMIDDGVDRVVPSAANFADALIPHEPARRGGTWLLWGLVSILLVVGLWEKPALARFLGLLVLGTSACLLVAAPFESAVATASALRWTLTGGFFAMSVVVWNRSGLTALGMRAGIAGTDESSPDSRRAIDLVLVFLTLIPVVVIALYVALMRLLDDPVLGPSSGSAFGRIGLAANLAFPLALAAAVLVGHAIRERSAVFAFGAGLVTNLATSLAWLFTAGTTLLLDDVELWIQLGQINAAVASTYGLAWLMALWWQARRERSFYAVHPLHVLQGALGLGLSLLVLLPATMSLVDTPSPVSPWIALGATLLGMTATALSFCLALLLAERRAPVVSISLVAVGLWSAATLAALFAAGHDTGNWLAFHTLIVGRTLSPALLLAGAWLWYRSAAPEFLARRRQAVTLWAVLSIPLVVMMAFRCYDDDPQGIWWSSIPVKTTAYVAVLVTLWSYRRRYLYLAGMLLLLATTLWYVHDDNPWRPSGDASVPAFFYLNLIALALPVVLWLLVELRWIRPWRDQVDGSAMLPFHRPATWISVKVLTLMLALLLLAEFYGEYLTGFTLWQGGAIAAVGIAAIACLWDDRAREAVFSLYVYGLALVLNYLDALNLEGEALVWRGAIALGAFNLATSYLWSRRAGLQLLAERLRMPARTAGKTEGLIWMVPVTVLAIGIVLALVFAIELSSTDRMLRVTAAQAALAQAFALAMLARGNERHHLRIAALAVGMLGMVALAWSWIEPTVAAPILARSVATCVALVVTAILYSLGFNRLPAGWTAWIEAARRFVPVLIVALVASIAVVLLQEVSYFAAETPVPLAWHGILAVALALGALFLAALGAALVPGRDPLSLSERGRMAYVYAAEAVLALLFLHIRVTMPWLFSGRFQQFWPLIVMVIAFLGVGLGEWFARRQQKILAEPLERTGILLPLLPVLGFWFFPSGTHYSVVLLIVGGLYATLAVTRKSFGFGLLAALAANGGLWHYLHQVGGVGLLQHPQLWLIPPALCVLAAAYLNRDRLSPVQMTSIRYITSMTIYLSSTADIFLNGVAQAPWLPLVLAALSLGGIFAGILVRVRAFLFLGTGFLILSIVTIIYHAAVNLHQTWIWAASITAAGIAIIVLFAIFEKKRQDVLRVVDNLRHWQA
ncbi:MAG: hypothetical protein KF708_09405 [Pirellulales bacterium]|nr:hypothetical protein [Pirellulales bacterium]